MAKLDYFISSCNVHEGCVFHSDSFHKLRQVFLHAVSSWDVYGFRGSYLNAFIVVAHLIG